MRLRRPVCPPPVLASSMNTTEVVWMPSGNPNTDGRGLLYFMAAALMGVPALAGRVASRAAWLMCMVMLACAAPYDV